MTYRTMYDAINASSLPTGGDLYAGYIDGHYNDYSAIQLRFLLPIVAIATNPTTNNGQVGDGPPDNGSWPEWVSWVQMRRSADADPTMYTNASSWAAGKAAFDSAGVPQPHWWIAHYDNDPTIPVGAVAKQYASNSLYDTSSVAEYWPGVDSVPLTSTPSEEDDFMAQSLDGQVDITWSTGTKHIVQVSYDTAGVNNGVVPNLRVVLLLDTGPLVISSDWQPTDTARTIDFSNHQANAYGISLQSVGTPAKYAAYVA